MSCFELFSRPSPYVEETGGLPIRLVTPDDLRAGKVPDTASKWARATGFSGKAGELTLLPSADGTVGGALFGLGAGDAPFVTGALARKLPEGNWRFEAGEFDACAAALGFGLGGYVFDRFRTMTGPKACLVVPEGVDGGELRRKLAGSFLARDLVNLPTNHMGPAALEDAFRRLAAHYGADVNVTAGEDLITGNFPMIHAVGRAGAEAPRLLDMRWGRKDARKVTLVGKGVCFDTGGLDIKPASSMLLMKKDMGGAANVMGLALMIMDAKLDVELRVLVPAVENSIAGNAFRPGDVLTSRKGITVQIDNTDAEGRLILADALALADEERPDLMVDMATLTGAARVALGPDVPPFYTHDDGLAASLAAACESEHDPVWRMPLYKPYDAYLGTKIADITNAPAGGFAGSITAALFLNRFVEQTASWAHFDIFAWSPKEKPHAPVGGEAQAIRALYSVISDHSG